VRTSTRLAGVEISNWKGEPDSLSRYWSEQPIVLVFIRHFG